MVVALGAVCAVGDVGLYVGVGEAGVGVCAAVCVCGGAVCGWGDGVVFGVEVNGQIAEIGRAAAYACYWFKPSGGVYAVSKLCVGGRRAGQNGGADFYHADLDVVVGLADFGRAGAR